MIEHPEQQVEGTSVLARAAVPEPAPALRLLIDQYLPRYDLAVVHAEVFHAEVFHAHAAFRTRER